MVHGLSAKVLIILLSTPSNINVSFAGRWEGDRILVLGDDSDEELLPNYEEEYTEISDAIRNGLKDRYMFVDHTDEGYYDRIEKK